MKNQFAAAIAFTTLLVLSGCKELDQINEVLVKPTQPQPQRRTASVSAPSLATPLAENETVKTQLVIPKDEKTKMAIEAALPNIKKVVGVHACVKDYTGLRLLNPYAVAGVDVGSFSYFPMRNMKYHDKNKCVGVRSIDQFSMLALNALKFRTVYFADDSGETANIFYRFKYTTDTSWELEVLSDSEWQVN